MARVIPGRWTMVPKIAHGGGWEMEPGPDREREIRRMVSLWSGVRVFCGVQWLGRLGLVAWTVGNTILFADRKPRPATVLHELVHVRQYRAMSPVRWVPFGIVLYALRWWAELLLGLLCYRSLHKAYRNISMEIEARVFVALHLEDVVRRLDLDVG